MKPNTLFIIIDGFRADKCYGAEKTSKTPNIDALIRDGAYFTQAISCSDGTRTCLGCIFSAKYPFQSGITTFSSHKNATRLFDFLKENRYHLYATVPSVDFWITLTKNFDGYDLFPKPYVYLRGGTGKEIIQRFEKGLSDPWVYYIHIMDLHRSEKFALPNEFNTNEFGSNEYERMVSYIDIWIGKILQKIDKEKTLIVLTSDHGDFIPISSVGHELDYIPELVKVFRKTKKFFPKLFHPIGLSFFLLLRKLLTPVQAARLKRKLTDEEMRTLYIRGNELYFDLYDQILSIPLIFSGYNIKQNKIISKQISQIDILPTIFEIINIKISENVEGRSLVPLINGSDLEELPVFIENQSLNPKKFKGVIGLRTSEYKYYRSYNNSKKNITLFDLKKDPNEKYNLADERLDLIEKMEKLLMEIREESSKKSNKEDLSPEETKKVEEELRKLGYI